MILINIFCFTVFGCYSSANNVDGCAAFCQFLPRIISFMGRRRNQQREPPDVPNRVPAATDLSNKEPVEANADMPEVVASAPPKYEVKGEDQAALDYDERPAIQYCP